MKNVRSSGSHRGELTTVQLDQLPCTGKLPVSVMHAWLSLMSWINTASLDQWYFKARDFSQTIKAYAADSSTTINGQHTMELIDNFEYTERRDLEKSDNTPHKRKGFLNYKAYTHFVLPVADFGSVHQETEYIVSTLTFFGSEIRRILSSRLFCATLRQCVHAYSPSLEQLTFAPTKGLDFPSFMRQCSVVVRPLSNYTDHIIRDRIPVLRNVLALHDETSPKYSLIPDADLLNVPLPVPDDTEETPSDNEGSEAPDDPDEDQPPDDSPAAGPASVPNSASYSASFNPTSDAPPGPDDDGYASANE